MIRPHEEVNPKQQQKQQQQQQELEQDSDKIEINSTKSVILEISATQTIHTLANQMSMVTQAIERLQNKLAATERKRSKREVKAVKLRIQRENNEKRDKAEQEERREEIWWRCNRTQSFKQQTHKEE